MRKEFIDSIGKNQGLFDLDLAREKVERLADYYQLILGQNDVLHLVAPCSPSEFATRHILESLTLLEFLPQNSILADVGTGAGLPAIPCLIMRDDLQAVLIESKAKKSSFLTQSAASLSLNGRAKVINKQFQEIRLDARVSIVTCRALDKFSEKLPALIKWSGGRGLLLFGGPDLKPQIEKAGKKVSERLMPLSERRYLYIA